MKKVLKKAALTSTLPFLFLGVSPASGNPVENFQAPKLDTNSAPYQYPYGYIQKSSVWRNRSIDVCWENPQADLDKFRTERDLVKNAIEKTWQDHSLVRFTGWENCSTGQNQGIHILINDEHPHVIGLGTKLAGKKNGMVLNFTFNNWSKDYCQKNRDFCIRVIAVHEFGHALGFAHEQNRPDKPSYCTEDPQGENGDTIVGSWDLNSVMNYCNPKYSGDGTLSETDLATLQIFYGDPYIDVPTGPKSGSCGLIQSNFGTKNNGNFEVVRLELEFRLNGRDEREKGGV